MITIIPKNLVNQRWDTLPQEIRDAMASDKNNDALERIYEQLHIPEDKKRIVARIAGYVFMGFVHAEDMARELEEALAMNSLHARELADSISRSVFAPYKELIEKIYTGKAEVIGARPTLDTIFSPEAKQPAVSPKSLESIAPSVANKLYASTGKSATMPNVIPPAPPKPFSPNIDAYAPPTSKPSPAPYIIHAETKSAPVVQAPKFTLESSGMGGSHTSQQRATAQIPPRPAQLEIGRVEIARPVEKITKIESSPRVVHYGGPSSHIIPGGISGASQPFGTISPMPAHTIDGSATLNKNEVARESSASKPSSQDRGEQAASAPSTNKTTQIQIKNPLSAFSATKPPQVAPQTTAPTSNNLPAGESENK